MGASRELWPDEYTVFNILYDKFLFWSIIVGLFAFAWLFIAIMRYRDGIEPVGKEEIKVGTFPKERHNFELELAWFVVPTILVLWVTFLAFGSMNIVWGDHPTEEESFTVEVNGIQWAWEFRYRDNLTWEDFDTGSDVSWPNGESLTISPGYGVTTADIEYDTSTTEEWVTDEGIVTIETNVTTNTMTMNLANQTTLEHPFNGDLHHKVTLLDADGNVVHRWQHIPVGHMMSSEFIIPCDENVTLNLHSDKYGDKNGIYQGVQHAFWLQEWGNKEDLVPGLEGGTWMYVQPNEAGTFPVRCAEYCGEMHSLMRGEVEVVAREEVGNCNENFGVYFDHGGEI